MGRKIIMWTLQVTNKSNFTRENLDMAKIEKSYERKRICSNSSTKYRHKDQLYQSKIDKM